MTAPLFTKGFLGLLASTKGVLCMLTLGCMTYLGAIGHLDGSAFAAGCGVITSVFCWARSKTDTHFGGPQ